MQLRLKAEYGISISAGRVYRLMKSMQLSAVLARKRPKMMTGKNCVNERYENILKQQFNPKSPNQVWASDITYIHTSKGYCYLCVVMDLFARKIISWQLSNSVNAKLVEKSVLQAWNNRGHPSSVIFHSDRGTQYTSEKIRNLLNNIGFKHSLSAPGFPYDNAIVECFFKYLKEEELNRRSFKQIDDVKHSVFSYIHSFYNAKRPHSANGGLSPDEREMLFEKENTK